MITIQRADEAFLQTIAAPAGVEAMVLRDSDGSVLGHALFSVTGERVTLHSVDCAIPLMAEGLIRSVLNVGDCRGAVEGFCADKNLETMLLRLEFQAAEDGYVVDLAHFFRGECHCK